MGKDKAAEYGCEVLLENTTIDKALDVNFPTDAYIVRYKLDDKDCIDLTRTGKLTSLFDMYYDTHGKNVIEKIEGVNQNQLLISKYRGKKSRYFFCL